MTAWTVLTKPMARTMHAPATAAQARAKPSSRTLSAAGLRTFFNITQAWGLSTDEQMVLLGAPGRSTFFKWKAAPQSADLKRDTLERLSYILGIYKALQILLPDASASDAWVKKPNTATLFAGRSALDRMLGGNIGDLLAVRQYLDARRGGWA